MKNSNVEVKKSITPDYITPTKERPVFTASCDSFGCIETTIYKDWALEIDDYISIGLTFSTNFADAINRLHEWIKENKDVIKTDPKCKFEIEVIDGSLRKDGDYTKKTLYSISASKAKKYLL